MALFPMKSHIIPYLAQTFGLTLIEGGIWRVSVQYNKQFGCQGAYFRAR